MKTYMNTDMIFSYKPTNKSIVYLSDKLLLFALWKWICQDTKAIVDFQVYARNSVFCYYTLKWFQSTLMSFSHLAHSSYFLTEFMTATVAHSLKMCCTLKGVGLNFFLTLLEIKTIWKKLPASKVAHWVIVIVIQAYPCWT